MFRSSTTTPSRWSVRRRAAGRRSASTTRAVVILPVPLDRTTSYVAGTRNGPREILQASSHMELWDEEMRADVHGVGIFTLPEMELPFGDDGRGDGRDRARRRRDCSTATSSWSRSAASTRSPRRSSSAAAREHPGLSVLQIDAHADLRDSYMGTQHNHACAMRRSLELRAADAGRHPQHLAPRKPRRCRR